MNKNFDMPQDPATHDPDGGAAGTKEFKAEKCHDKLASEIDPGHIRNIHFDKGLRTADGNPVIFTDKLSEDDKKKMHH